MEIKSYHIPSQEAEAKLCGLVQKVYKAGQKSLIVCQDDSSKKSLDQKLWTFSQSAFLPHAIIEEVASEDQIQAQPIILASHITQNNASKRDAQIIFINSGQEDFLKEELGKVSSTNNKGEVKSVIIVVSQQSNSFPKEDISMIKSAVGVLLENQRGEGQITHHVFDGTSWKAC